jgi:hypothetical protein
MKTFHTSVCCNPDVSFAIFEEAEDKVSRQTFLSSKSVNLTTVDAIDASVYGSYPKSAVAVLK